MNTPLLTIAEATRKTGRSASTIRRLIHEITEAESHPDRSGIEPSPAKVAGLKKKGESFTWHIREELVTSHFNGAPSEEKKSTSKQEPNLYAILQTELNMKNTQIEKQWEVITSLNERLREGNILMASLQKRLALPSPVEPQESILVGATMEPSKKAPMKASKKPSMKASTEATKKVSTEVLVETPVKKPTRSWLLRWMGK